MLINVDETLENPKSKICKNLENDRDLERFFAKPRDIDLESEREPS